jgi:hypothetical protein
MASGEIRQRVASLAVNYRQPDSQAGRLLLLS